MNSTQLIASLRGGDSGAVTELMKLYGDRLQNAAFSFCRNETLAQDLVQNTLIEAVKSVHNYQRKSNLYSWLRGILRNMYYRYRRKHTHTVLVAHIPTQQVSPFSITRRMDMESGDDPLARAIEELSPDHKEVIMLRFYKEMKVSEIAEHLDISLGTVKSRLHNALKQLQQYLIIISESEPF